MDDDQLAALVEFYLRTAYSSMGREMPEDADFAQGVCLHWSEAGKVGSLKEWAKKMGLFTETPQRESLQFYRQRPDGIRVPITQGEQWR